VAGAAPAKFRPTGGRGRLGAGGRRPCGCLGPILGAGWGLGGGRRRDFVARSGGVRLELGSGELSAETSTRAALLVLGGAREGEELPICCGDTRGWKFSYTGTYGAR
jgi:hypothetical protein